MKILGIDYGTKKIGLALSDEGATFAFPHSIVVNDGRAFDKIVAVVRGAQAGKVVVGESVDYKGENNPIMDEVYEFADRLEKQTGVEVFFEPEFLTTTQAGKEQGRRDNLDSSAAALILRSFLEKEKNEPSV